MSDQAFEIAQALRRSHCDRKEQAHECVGEVTIKRGMVCLDCKLCGKGEEIPGWNGAAATSLRLIFAAAGIEWASFDIETKVRVISEFREHTK